MGCIDYSVNPSLIYNVNGRGRFGGQIAKSLSSGQAASLCSAGIERTRKCLQGEHCVRCCHSAHSLVFRGFQVVVEGGRQQFATQTLPHHL